MEFGCLFHDVGCQHGRRRRGAERLIVGHRLERSASNGEGAANRFAAQCLSDVEKRLTITTPAMINPSPIRAAASSACLNQIQLTAEIRMMPTPDHMA